MKAKINFIIDALMFVCMSGILGIGFLIKYILIPGRERWDIYKRNVELYFLGLDRHEWGEIHFVLGVILVILLVFHIILHWNVIVSIYKNLFKNKAVRYIIGVIFIFICIISIVFPIFVKPEIKEEEKDYKKNRKSFKENNIKNFKENNAKGKRMRRRGLLKKDENKSKIEEKEDN